MTEHKNIPLPDGNEPEKNEGSTESSLFERASGAFGFDPFKPTPIKTKLPEREMKRAKVRAKNRGKDDAKEIAAEGASQSAPRSEPAEEIQAEVCAPAENLPVPAPTTMPAVVPAAELTVDQDVGSVALSGKKFPVDREFLREQGMIVPEGAVTALMEEFRIVKRQILKATLERGTGKSRRILICSPHPNEGKTFCATNLAIAMAAERDGEVLLIDADFAKPSVLSTLGLPKGPGFMDCLADPSVQPEELVIGTDIPGLWVLPTGNQTTNDSEYLASERTGEVLDRLTNGAPNRIIIFDTPPALSASPAAELARHVGQALLVARADKTGQSALEDACQLLSACPDIKLLLNAAHFSPSGRKFGSYYGYGE